jgi:hypothetical protein
MIPNIIHFMYFTGPGSREFSFINYLAVRSAFDVQKPDVIYFYYDVEPVNNIHWNNMKQYVTMVKIDKLLEFRGVRIDYPQYQADVVRLQKLLEVGGIYLDTDILTIKPFSNLLEQHCVLGAEGYRDNVSDLHTCDVLKIGSVSNAVIMAEPNSRFIKDWLDRLPEALMTNIWAYHAVVLPYQMYVEDPSYFNLQKVESFIPFDFRNNYIFEINGGEIHKDRLRDSYTVHMWETIWQNELNKIDNLSKGQYYLCYYNVMTDFKK